ncbi:hypothetical protein MIDIC_490018 [Alphaproteobacteria bacterium]
MMVGTSKTPIFRWESLKKESGDVSPNGNKPTKANHEQLMQIITGNPHLTQKEIGAMVGMAATNICRVFQRMRGFQKKEHFTNKQTSRQKKGF